MKDIIESDIKNFFSGMGKKKEYIGDLITIKARNIKGCSLYINRSIKFNIAPDPEFGIIKTRFRASYHGEYKIAIGDGRNFDTLIMLGIDRTKEIIEKVYAIPKKELHENRFITITKTGQGYQEFRIDEKPYNKIVNYLKTGKYSLFEDGDITIDKKRPRKK